MGKLTYEQERGLRIKELRERAGLHLNVLAQQAGLGSGGVRNGQTIKNWEAGGGIVHPFGVRMERLRLLRGAMQE